MAFTLDPAVPLPRSLRHVALEELKGALRHLKAGRAGDVHELRKSTKRLRAWLRLLRDELDRDYVVLNALLRDAARAVAGSRERDVARLTLRSLQRSLRLTPAEAQALRDAVFAHLPPESARQQRHGRRLSAQLFAIAREYLRHVPLAAVDAKRIAKSLAANQRRCLKAYKRARRRPTPEHLHEWRKLAKYRRYQLGLVEPVIDDGGRKQLKRLSDALGQHHDLHMLAIALRRVQSPHRDRALREIRGRQARLEPRALALGKELFA